MFDWITQLLTLIIGVIIGLCSYKYTDSYRTYKKSRKTAGEVIVKLNEMYNKKH